MPRRPHILHVIDSLAPGGAERMAVEIANATDKKRYQVSICVTRSNSGLQLQSILSTEVPLVVLPRTSRGDITAYWKFRQLCKEQKIDVLHVHNRPSIRFIGLVSFLKFLPDIPVVFLDQYGDIEFSPQMPWSIRCAINLVKPTYVGVHPDLTAHSSQQGIAARAFYTITNAIDFTPYQTAKPLSRADVVPSWARPPIGIIVANVRPQKDYLGLIDALAGVQHLPWHLLIVGSTKDTAYVKACEKKIHEKGLHQRITFMGTRMDVPSLLRTVDFALLSSRSESGPLVLLEYAAANLPFVSTRVGLIGKSLEQLGVEGFVPPGDTDEFANALQSVLSQRDEDRVRRGIQTGKLASQEFNILNVINEWYKVYEFALSGSSPK